MVSINLVIAILAHAIVLSGVIPLFVWLPLLPQILLAVCFAVSLWQERFGSWRLKGWRLNVAAVPLFIYYASQFSRHNAVEPVSCLLVVMLSVRLAGEKNGRHYLQILALSLFCLSASTLFDLSPSFLLHLFAMLFMVASALVLLAFHESDSCMSLSRADMRRVLWAGMLMPLASLPLLLLFFAILPRTQLPLWNFLNMQGAATTGFADKVEPGAVSVAASNRVLAFRAEMPQMLQKQLYWRGTVFNRLEGNRWRRDDKVPAEQLIYGHPRIRQIIYQEPGLSRYVMALDAPAETYARRVLRSPDGVLLQLYPSGRRFSHEAHSFQGGVLAVASAIRRDFYLRLPGSVSPRIRQLVADLVAGIDSDGKRLAALEGYLRNGGYRYAAQDMPIGEDALEQFLFVKKQGNCEFFASALGIMLRLAGVPCRLVGGYLGGEYNQLGGYYQISEDMAHVWVETHVAGQGWLRIDPSSFAVNADAVWSPRAPGFWKRLVMVVDSAEHAWNRSVVTYDLESQMEIARSAGRRLQRIKGLRLPEVGAPWLLSIASVGVALIIWLWRRWFHLSREQRIIRAFAARVRRDYGLTVVPERQGLYGLARQTGSRRMAEFADIYAGAVYRDRRLTREECGRLRAIIRAGFKQ
ncbi:MAG TPA: transglutaminaseTgpA domain-containing protein [Deltaproteobacteria bacterium]|nr:transglutaminaseTgpA domain-containing protein [Deltaproteobacteria bacterium]